MDPFRKQFTNQTITTCKYCGRPLIMLFEDSDGNPVDPILERQARAHTKCLDKAAKVERAKWEAEHKNDPIVQKEVSQTAIDDVLKNMPKPEDA
jgi:hypothetical protein